MLTELVDIPAGVFRMGSTSFYPEEAPIHSVAVQPFAMESHPVTNAQYAAFVAATGYVTVAEQQLDPARYGDAQPGALVFTPTSGPVDLQDWRQWWRWVPGANWRHPLGPRSSVEDKLDHPVVQVAYPTRRRTRGGRGGGCPPKPNGSTPLGPGPRPPIRGARRRSPAGPLMANTWQERSRTAMPVLWAGPGLRRSAPLPPTPGACST